MNLYRVLQVLQVLNELNHAMKISALSPKERRLRRHICSFQPPSQCLECSSNRMGRTASRPWAPGTGVCTPFVPKKRGTWWGMFHLIVTPKKDRKVIFITVLMWFYFSILLGISISDPQSALEIGGKELRRRFIKDSTMRTRLRLVCVKRCSDIQWWSCQSVLPKKTEPHCGGPITAHSQEFHYTCGLVKDTFHFFPSLRLVNSSYFPQTNCWNTYFSLVNDEQTPAYSTRTPWTPWWSPGFTLCLQSPVPSAPEAADPARGNSQPLGRLGRRDRSL